jgi:hypothetical protein
MTDAHSFNNICEIVDIIESVNVGNYPADFNRSSETLETYLHKKYIVLLASNLDDIPWEQHLGI